MKYEITADTTFPMLKVYLNQGEAIKAESGAMVAMTRDLSLTGKMDGGFFKSIARRFAGESFFLQQISAERGPGWALLAAAAPGEIAAVDVEEGKEWTVQKNGFLAGSPTVQVSTKVQSIWKGMWSGEGLFVVKISGEGKVFLATYGSIYTIDIPARETLLIDNGHLMAWQSAMKYDIVKGASSWFSSATSGEGLACLFHGPGRVLIQTRNPAAFGQWMFPYLPIPAPQPQR